MIAVWPKLFKLHELGRGATTFALEADSEARRAIAKDLGLESLESLTARITASPWFDGLELNGAFQADVEQVCGVTLDPFMQTLHGEITVRVVPQGSPHAPNTDDPAIELDPEAPDAPDVLLGDTIDVSGYVVEHLALELDPFPRKPGVRFEYEAPSEEISPFAVLKALGAPKG